MKLILVIGWHGRSWISTPSMSRASRRTVRSSDLGATYELILLTDLLTADMDGTGCCWTQPPSAPAASRPNGRLRTDLDGRNLATDQKVGGSSPSERAQVTGPYPLRGGVFFVPLGAMLGATAADPGPNSARLMDAATARLSPSTRCPYTSLVIVMLAWPKISDTTCSGVSWASTSPRRIPYASARMMVSSKRWPAAVSSRRRACSTVSVRPSLAAGRRPGPLPLR